MVKSLPALRETQVQSLGREDSPGEGNGNPLQYSCLENPMDGGAWQATVHRGHKELDKSWKVSDFTFKLFFFFIIIKVRGEGAQTMVVATLGGMGDVLGGPVVKTPRSQCRGPGFEPWSGK